MISETKPIARMLVSLSVFRPEDEGHSSRRITYLHRACCAAGISIRPVSANGMVRPCSGPASKRSWQGAPKTRSTPCHTSWNRRDRYRYRQELVSRRGSRSAWRDRPAPEVVSRPSGNTARQSAALSHRHGGLRRRTPSEPQTHIAWPRRSADASQICAALLEGAEERLPRRGG